MQARRGLSLTEVLIAIFVMAIGMIALLVLFPLGMLNMAWALKNNRASQAISGANAVADLPTFVSAGGNALRFNLRDDPTYLGALKSGAYTDLWGGAPPAWSFNDKDPRTAMVLYVDPVGQSSLGVGTTVGGRNAFQVLGLGWQTGIPRVSTTPAGSNQMAAKNWCAQEDDVTFNPDGSATVDPLTPVVERGRRYSWAYSCRWSRMSDASVVQMSVVIYSGRATPISLPTSGNNSKISTELFYLGGGGFLPPANPPQWWPQLAFRQGSTTATIMKPPTTGAGFGMPWPLPLKRGDWIFDDTLVTPQDNTQPLLAANGYFYKVIGISDPYINSLNNQVQDVQLDRPARENGFAVVLLQNVVDVRDKSDGRMPVK
jgi:hypothetical protein